LSLYVWVIPVILIAPDTKTKIAQFNLVIEMGARYLQPSSRTLGALFASLAVLFYCHPDPMIASRWRDYAMAMGALVSTAPYEIYAVFPTNDKIGNMGQDLKITQAADFGDKRDKEVDELLKKWRKRHIGRIVAPFGALLVSIWTVVTN